MYILLYLLLKLFYIVSADNAFVYKLYEKDTSIENIHQRYEQQTVVECLYKCKISASCETIGYTEDTINSFWVTCYHIKAVKSSLSSKGKIKMKYLDPEEFWMDKKMNVSDETANTEAITNDATTANGMTIQSITIEPNTTESITTVSETTKQEAIEPETTQPETTEPETTQPKTIEPSTTQQETKEPATTQQETTEPATTQQETTEPATTQQETTEPATTQPETAEPITAQQETIGPDTTVVVYEDCHDVKNNVSDDLHAGFFWMSPDGGQPVYLACSLKPIVRLRVFNRQQQHIFNYSSTDYINGFNNNDLNNEGIYWIGLNNLERFANAKVYKISFWMVYDASATANTKTNTRSSFQISNNKEILFTRNPYAPIKLDNQRQNPWQLCEGNAGEGSGHWWQCEENGKFVAPTLKDKLVWYEDDNPKQLMITLHV